MERSYSQLLFEPPILGENQEMAPATPLGVGGVQLWGTNVPLGGPNLYHYETSRFAHTQSERSKKNFFFKGHFGASIDPGSPIGIFLKLFL